MIQKLTLTPEESAFLKKVSRVVVTENGDKYMHIPIWYKITEEENVVEEYTYNIFPKDLKKAIKALRKK